MEKQYKECVINTVYGFMEGTFEGIKQSLNNKFKLKFGFSPDVVECSVIKDKINDEYPPSWIGAIELSIKIGEESFSVTRDFEEEYIHDITHPDYESDEWFYESDKCYSHRKYLELINELS